MKKQLRCLCAFMFILFLSAKLVCSSGGPYLTCDPYPATVNGQPVSFILEFDGQQGVEVAATPSQQPNMVVILYSLLTISEGSHTVVARAKVGDQVSGASNPYTFVKQYPALPNRIGISSN